MFLSCSEIAKCLSPLLKSLIERCPKETEAPISSLIFSIISQFVELSSLNMYEYFLQNQIFQNWNYFYKCLWNNPNIKSHTNNNNNMNNKINMCLSSSSSVSHSIEVIKTSKNICIHKFLIFIYPLYLFIITI